METYGVASVIEQMKEMHYFFITILMINIPALFKIQCETNCEIYKIEDILNWSWNDTINQFIFSFDITCMTEVNVKIK